MIALGVAWILDGLEITIASNVTRPDQSASPPSTFLLRGGLRRRHRLSARRGGRRAVLRPAVGQMGPTNLFMITLGVYLFGGALTALRLGTPRAGSTGSGRSRFIAGMGIGGEYAAINSAIDELIPAKYRGRVDIAVNGTYWGGALLASVLAHPGRQSPARQLLVAGRLPLRPRPRLRHPVRAKNLPESPRWLLMHGRKRRPKRPSTTSKRRAKNRRHPRRGRRVQGHGDHAGQQHRLLRLGHTLFVPTRSAPSSAPR